MIVEIEFNLRKIQGEVQECFVGPDLHYTRYANAFGLVEAILESRAVELYLHGLDQLKMKTTLSLLRLLARYTTRRTVLPYIK